MKPTANETYFAHGGHPVTQTCVVCGLPYRGSHTTPWPVGNGRYRDFPCHVKCESTAESETRGDDDI